VAGLALDYYWVLRSVLRDRPELRRCLCRCRHCGIFFLTDPRNAGRRDLGCPFGCQQSHRRCESTRRSVAYYRGPEGKMKKRLQNSRRCRVLGQQASVAREEDEDEAGKSTAVAPVAAASVAVATTTTTGGLSPARPRWSEALVEHVRVVCSLIEGRRVSRGETVEMLRKVLRQHSMARRRRIDQVVAQLHQTPP
jgi:hypothetical protein